ncbi:heavy metal translocating P-type ATPase [Deltaproteobacteria bacterium IMCC39524]|nr:heavy metal translocating P-type ATPase [Deltaproteobacteria bacterium IMCC39524]
MVTTDTCIHCKLPIPRGDLVVDEIDGKELHFCCHGCQGVYRVINGAGLGKFYQQRDWHQEGVPQGVFDTAFDEALLAGHVVTRNETSAEIALIIEGIRCASCVWLLEKLIHKVQGVETIRVNYGTHRAQISFNPKETTPKEIFTSISRLGYLPHPYTSGAAQQAAAKEQRSLLIRFGTAAFLSMQVMGFSFALYGGYFHGIDPSIRETIQYFAAAVATPVVFYSGWPFFAGAWRSIRNKAPSMDLLITLGVTTAYSYSIYSMLAGGEVYFDTAAMIITLILLGRLFEGSARNRSISGIDKLLRLAPESANLIEGEDLQVVACTSLKPGDLTLVRPGERIPVDGLIHRGKTELDEATISGEPMPVLRQQGDTVLAGTLNLSSSFQLQVERVAAESFIARMALMVEEAQNRKAPIQSLADKVATLFVPFVTLTAAGTWLFWFLHDVQSSAALLNAVSVLIVACPCALGLATPTAVLVASGNAATRGILFRGGDILEMTARIGTIAFDKTGTLTLGKPTVEKIIPAPGQSEASLLRLASQVENGSSHPIARGIIDRAKAAGVHIGPTRSVDTVLGRGLRMVSPEGEILVGSLAFLEECNVEIPAVESGSLTEVYVSLAGLWMGTLLIVDPLREEAASAVKQLQQIGLRTVLLTGDRLATAQEVSSKLAISDFHSNLNPADKTEWIRTHQEAGEKIMMVGDGINDAPALSLADVGCAMAGGTDIALETSDLVLTRANLGRLYEAISIARKTLLVIKQNLFWAFAYNLITIPLAASGNLAPVWAALTMASSSVIVVSNSLRLGRVIRRTFSVAKA